VLSQVKLIAEPWDVDWSGYQVGHFPVRWSEWNGKYRDTTRRLWRGEDHTFPDMALRLVGSPDLYGDDARSPWHSVNFITAHDGYTLADLVSYDDEGHHAHGWGAHGPTDDAGVQAHRAQMQRTYLATLLLSHGVPMILGGDEFGRTQQGNHNAYNQDNELSWFDWEAAADNAALTEFTARLIALRRAHPVLRRPGWFRGADVFNPDAGDLCWFLPDGSEARWHDFNAGTKTVVLFLNGAPLDDDSFVLLLNAWSDDIAFTLPDRVGGGWSVELATAAANANADDVAVESPVRTPRHSLLLLRRTEA